MRSILRAKYPSTRRPALAIIALLIATSTAAQFGGGPALVDVATVESRSLAPTISVPGTVISRDRAEISAETGGRLLSVAEVGDVMEKGEVLARIDSRELELRLAEQRSNAAQQSSRIGFLEKEVARLEKLTAQNNASISRLEEVQSDLAATRAGLGAVQARVQTTQLLLSYSELRAPFAGQVTARRANPGETVTSGTAVVELTNLKRLEVAAYVPVRTVRYLDTGRAIRVSNDRQSGSGVLRTLVPAGGNRTHMYELRVSVESAAFRANEDVRVEVPTADAVLQVVVPRDALVLRRGATTVFRIGSENSAEAVPVTTSTASGALIAVEGTLQPGDQVVVRGAEGLRDGQAIQIRKRVGSGTQLVE